MARISSYPVDQNIVGQDKLLGTDNAGLITKNYTLDGISGWMNANGSLQIVGQSNYSFNVAGETVGVISGPAANATFASITTMAFSKTSTSGNNVIDYLLTLVGRDVILARLDNLNNFGVYKLVSLVVDAGDANYYNATFTVITANGNIIANKYYGFAIYPEVATTGDLNFTFTQGTPATTWTITHNLGKFPSVSVVDTADTQVYGEVEYIDDNSLRITFSAAFGGKAYLN
jgi:hypothetical protein